MNSDEAQINVLYLVDSLEMGGLERVVCNLALGVDRKKYNVEVCCIVSGGVVAEELLQKGINVHVLCIQEYGKWKNIKKLACLLKELDVDIVHIHGTFAQKIGVIAALIAGVAVKIVHIHTTFYNLNRKNVLIDRLLRNFVDRIIYISESCLESFKRKGYKNGKKSVVIYNGVRIPVHSKEIEKGNNLIFAVVASLSRHKGHKYLLRAIHQTKDYDVRVKLWIIGDGPLKGELEKLAHELKIGEQVEFLGIREDVGHLLSEVDVFILPSLREGLSLALIEAMAHGKAIIASNVGGIPELIEDGETGLLVEPANAEKLVEKICCLIHDCEMRETLGRQARIFYEQRFTLDRMKSKIDKLYEQCLREKK